MARLIPSPWAGQFDQLINAAQASLVVCSPYVGLGPCRRIIETVRLRGLSDILKVALLTDLSLENMLCRTTDVSALIELQNAIPNTEIRFLPSLHAKVYVADTYGAIVTSSNLTDNGILRNFEYGVWIDDVATVTAIRDGVLVYSRRTLRLSASTNGSCTSNQTSFPTPSMRMHGVPLGGVPTV